MGFVVLHIDKASGNDAGMTAHIERTIDPVNADKERTHLNREIVEFPEGVASRTQAIQHRLDNAGLTRKIGTNQVRALRIMLSGTPEDMQKIEAAGKLGEWCNDNLNWLRKTFGADNVVSAVLHMDEKTPHIHATVVPIVTGDRRKASQVKPAEPGKKQYKKKRTTAPRLCADDVMARDKLKSYQDTYAGAMVKYGLQRGIDGSEARHITNIEYARNIAANKQTMEDEIDRLGEMKETRRQEVMELEQQEQQAYTRTEQAIIKAQQAEAGQKQIETALADTRKELSRERGKLTGEKFKNTAAEAGAKIADGIGSLFGSSKIERLQQEVDTLKTDKADLTRQLQDQQKQVQAAQRSHEAETAKLQQALNKIDHWFPDTPKLIRLAEYCHDIGFTVEQTRSLVNLHPVQFSGQLYSREHNQRFDTGNVTARIEKHSDGSGNFRLTLNGTGIIKWFREKFDEWLQRLGIKSRQVQEPKQSKGFRL